MFGLDLEDAIADVAEEDEEAGELGGLVFGGERLAEEVLQFTQLGQLFLYLAGLRNGAHSTMLTCRMAGGNAAFRGSDPEWHFCASHAGRGGKGAADREMGMRSPGGEGDRREMGKAVA